MTNPPTITDEDRMELDSLHLGDCFSMLGRIKDKAADTFNHATLTTPLTPLSALAGREKPCHRRPASLYSLAKHDASTAGAHRHAEP